MSFPVDEKYIVETEQLLGIHFPESYREKMKIANGGCIATGGDEWMLHPFFDQSDRKRISRTANHIIRETEVAKKWSGFPQNAIVIGSNGAGDRLVFIRDAKNQSLLQSSVFWWDHEIRKLNLVVDDFSELPTS